MLRSLKFGVLADTSVQLEDLNKMVQGAGHTVEVSFQAASCQLESLPQVDAWVVRLGMNNDDSLELIEILDSLSVPVIYDDVESFASMGTEERIKRFTSKIHYCASSGISSTLNRSRAKQVWVLAASTGGPDAVGRFLKLIPDDLRDVAFIYVQHIDSEITETLQKAIARHTTWQIFNCEKTQVISERSIYVISPEHQVDIDKSGVLAPSREPWSTTYKPSADQVIARVARVFGRNSGAIIFSGMGDDGARSCSFMKNSGGAVWIQEPDSCAVDSMPISVQKTGTWSYRGTPEVMARQFIYGR